MDNLYGLMGAISYPFNSKATESAPESTPELAPDSTLESAPDSTPESAPD